jgi:hydroxyethylthiazole kinase-like uncharacterized protein yjeF
MAGAAVLASRGALRAGSGLVTVAIPEPFSNAVTAAVPEATQIHLPEEESAGEAMTLESRLPQDLGRRFDVIAAGPGIGQSSASSRLLELVLARGKDLPMVLDADALNLVAAGIEVDRRPDLVWTPHPGELRRLSGETPRSEAERIEACERFVRRRGGVIVLKGHRSIVHDGERYFINVTGNPGMATGGAGDVLTGVVASLLGQALSPFDAARLAVHLHGFAGDLAARRLGPASLTAGDIAEALPAALQAHAAAFSRSRR